MEAQHHGPRGLLVSVEAREPMTTGNARLFEYGVDHIRVSVTNKNVSTVLLWQQGRLKR